jgi:hypothetical protein
LDANPARSAINVASQKRHEAGGQKIVSRGTILNVPRETIEKTSYILREIRRQLLVGITL